MARTLVVRREALTELSTDDLAVVVGGQTLTGYYPTLNVLDCLNRTTLTGQ